MDRPEFSGEKNQRHEIQSAMKQGLGLVIKVPACTIILESGYPFLDGSTATIKLRHPHSPNASVYFDDTTTRNSHDEGNQALLFLFFFSPYYTIDLQTYDFSAIKINSDIENKRFTMMSQKSDQSLNKN